MEETYCRRNLGMRGKMRRRRRRRRKKEMMVLTAFCATTVFLLVCGGLRQMHMASFVGPLLPFRGP